MNRTCRICSDYQGTYRTVTVGGGLNRRWSVCDHCLDSLRGADWLSVDEGDDADRVILHVDPGTLVGSHWTGAE